MKLNNIRHHEQHHEQDHEVDMAQTDTYHLAKQAKELHHMLMSISEFEGLQGWQQSKITKAADYIDSVYKDIAHRMAMDDHEDGDVEHLGHEYEEEDIKENSDSLEKYGLGRYNELNNELKTLNAEYQRALKYSQLMALNDIHRRILEVIKQLKSFSTRQMKSVDESGMGGINRAAPSTNVSYQKVLDEPEEQFSKGQRIARQIGRAKEAISYEERLAEFLNAEPEGDYIAEENNDYYIEELDIEVIGGKSPLIVDKNEITLEGIEISGLLEESLMEAEYQGRKVQLNKPVRSSGGPKKFHVFVKDPKTGNVKKVNFGDPDMKIKKSNPKRRKSFRARHRCDNPGPKTKARYWSCRSW